MFADIDRDKVQILGVAPSQVFSTLQVFLGSAYINDFNLFGRTFRVTAQANALASSDAALTIAQIAVFKALGSGWERALVVTVP